MKMKKWQIMRMMSGKQQTYDVNEKKWKTSDHRWTDEFQATTEEARKIFKKVLANFRKVHFCSYPKLHEIIG